MTSLRLLRFTVVLLMLTGCATNPVSGDAIESLCSEWGRSLPTWQDSDSLLTRQEIDRAYRVHRSVCRK
jgi:hypothetical protein